MPAQTTLNMHDDKRFRFVDTRAHKWEQRETTGPAECTGGQIVDTPVLGDGSIRPCLVPRPGVFVCTML